MYFRFTALLLWVGPLLFAQQTQVRGFIFDELTQQPITNAIIKWIDDDSQVFSQKDGGFAIHIPVRGLAILVIEKNGFEPKRISVQLEGIPLVLDTLFLVPELQLEKSDNLVTLTDADFSDDVESLSSSIGLLQASRDIFLNRAAFDFGQAFFRVRGYDSREGQVLLNGLKMNKLLNGRPQWNNWGGLNDVIRNQEFSNGLGANRFTFGGILGNTNIDLRPSIQRPGIRLSSSFSNRTYAGRIMATYNSGQRGKGPSYSFSGSRRWAKQGFIDGTLYDAFSFFGALEYPLSPKNSFTATMILAKNRRGRSSAITEEVFGLSQKQYNPYWGEQNGKIRNSRQRTIFEPIFLVNHYYTSKRFRWVTGLSYQTGKHTRSRLGYYNAPNPDPTYYRYLPSFYINNSIGADFTNAALARDGFLKNQQINWPQLYTANTNPESLGKAAYVLYDDTSKDSQVSLVGNGTWRFNEKIGLDFGFSFRSLRSKNFAQIDDLLGADFHEDVDPFSETQNDLNSNLNKTEGAVFNYNYHVEANDWNTFAQLNFSNNGWSGFVSGILSGTTYRRNGIFQNERFLANSKGQSKIVEFFNIGIKSGVNYQLTARHWVQLNSALVQRPPTLQNAFINPRENNEIVPNLNNETLYSISLNYLARLPRLTGRLTGFYTRFQNTTDINFFFVDAGVGSDFVQEVLTNLDRLHRGIELGLEYQASPEVKLSLAANFGNYVFASNPDVSINFDTAGAEEDLINPQGNIDLGQANIKGLRLPQGPQTAVAFGVEYRNPKYWWIGATANYLADNFASISTITRTSSFILNPDTGEAFPEATPENVNRLLKQNSLDDFYLLNLIGGKSWLTQGKYISLFLSVNNVFDEVFRTGGYEQSRNGNFGQLQQDNLRNDPSFAPKYWYGFGRTFFLNLAVSF